MKSKKIKRNFQYVPRIVIKMNTGTRTILSKKDKAKTRRELNRKAKEQWQTILRFAILLNILMAS